MDFPCGERSPGTRKASTYEKVEAISHSDCSERLSDLFRVILENQFTTTINAGFVLRCNRMSLLRLSEKAAGDRFRRFSPLHWKTVLFSTLAWNFSV